MMAKTDLTWLDLAGTVTPEVLHAPKTGGDPSEVWPGVHSRIARYLMHNVAGTPWTNHLALIAAVVSAKRYDVATIQAMMVTLHVHLKALFQRLALTEIEEWDAVTYFPSYLKGEIFPEDSLYRRMAFWNRYNTATKQVWLWLESLPLCEKETYRPFTFPVVPPLAVAGLVKHAEVKQHQHQVRKSETDALVPHFATLRSEAHLRFNRIVRLRQAYHEALKEGVEAGSAFPLEFSYVKREGEKHLSPASR
jgi:hypothetical protein